MPDSVDLRDDLGFTNVPRIETNELVLGGANDSPINKRLSLLKSRDRVLADSVQANSDRLQALEQYQITAAKEANTHNSRIAMCRLSLDPKAGYHGAIASGTQTLYLNRFEGDYISLWDTSEDRWVPTELPGGDDASISLDFASASPGNYDIFCYLLTGEPRLFARKWPDSSPGVNSSTYWNTGFDWNDSVPVDDQRRRFLGTVHLKSTGLYDDYQYRLVSNYYNQRPKNLVMTNDVPHRYTSLTWRPYAASLANRFETVFAKSPNYIDIRIEAFAGISSACRVGIGLNDATVPVSRYISNTSYLLADNLLSVDLFSVPIGFGFSQLFALQQTLVANPNVSNHATYSRMTMSGMINA